MKDWFKIIVADQHHFDGDPDPADQFDADLDSAATFMRGWIRVLPFNPMRIHADPEQC